MADLRFEWDPRKDAANQRKHGVSFAEAESVFADEHGLLLDDPDHSTVEDRIISARRATRTERTRCEERWRP
jgi:uncharacterized DUF497 family protein